MHEGKIAYLRYLVGLLERHGVTGGSVLDIGSGYGFFLKQLEESGYQPFGLEQSEHASLKAKEISSAEIHTGSAESPLPFPDSRFQAITMLDVIEHLDDYRSTLRECHRVLAPRGVLLVITLNSRSLARLLLRKNWSWYQDPTHLHMFSARTLRQAFAAAGFERVRSKSFFNFNVAGESTPVLKPLRRLGAVLPFPWFGDSILVLGRASSSR